MPARIWLFWALFLLRGAFYSAMLPLWEGWDEYAHFAFVQHWVDHGTLPKPIDRISREIDESMRLAPLARELRWIGAPYLTHPEWWALPESERTARARALRALSPQLGHQPAQDANGKPLVFYEAQQTPLFYWIASPVIRVFDQRPIGERVFLLRLLSLLFCSLTIPFTFLTARGLSGATLAGYSAALLAVAPGLVIDGAHVANDGVAIGVTAIFLWLMTREKTGWVAAGGILGAAILAKASLLVLVPVLAVLWIRRPKQLALALAFGFAIGGWWYVRNLMIGMPLIGLQESAPLSEVAASAVALFHNGGWVNEAHTIAKSFIWFGAWSFISLRAWMYFVLEVCGIAGMLAGIATLGGKLRAPITMTVAFTVAIIGGAASYYAVHNIAGIPGWYLWPAGGAMAILVAAGLGRFSVLFAAMLALVDLYGATTRLMPYYAGLAEWNHGSVLQLPVAAGRLDVGIWLIVAWVLATVAIPLLMFQGLMFQGRAKTRM